jgi:hypothetical protein
LGINKEALTAGREPIAEKGTSGGIADMITAGLVASVAAVLGLAACDTLALGVEGCLSVAFPARMGDLPGLDEEGGDEKGGKEGGDGKGGKLLGGSKGVSELQLFFQRWENATQCGGQRHCRFLATEDYPCLGGMNLGGIRKISGGELWVRGRDLLRVELRDATGQLEEIAVLENDLLRRYSFRERTELVWPLKEYPPEAFLNGNLLEQLLGQAHLQRFQWVYVGLPVAQLQRRFATRVLGERQNCVHLELKPRCQQDWGFGDLIQIGVDKKTFKVRFLRYSYIDGTVLAWSFAEVNEASHPDITQESISRRLPGAWHRIDVSLPIGAPIPRR